MFLKIKTVSEILTFSNICSKFNGDVNVISDNFRLNAKSFMGLLSLDYSKPVKVEVYPKDRDLISYEKILSELKPYLET